MRTISANPVLLGNWLVREVNVKDSRGAMCSLKSFDPISSFKFGQAPSAIEIKQKENTSMWERNARCIPVCISLSHSAAVTFKDLFFKANAFNYQEGPLPVIATRCLTILFCEKHSGLR